MQNTITRLREENNLLKVRNEILLQMVGNKLLSELLHTDLCSPARPGISSGIKSTAGYSSFGYDLKREMKKIVPNKNAKLMSYPRFHIFHISFS